MSQRITLRKLQWPFLVDDSVYLDGVLVDLNCILYEYSFLVNVARIAVFNSSSFREDLQNSAIIAHIMKYLNVDFQNSVISIVNKRI